jgi:hypothetical protein
VKCHCFLPDAAVERRRKILDKNQDAAFFLHNYVVEQKFSGMGCIAPPQAPSLSHSSKLPMLKK